MKSNKGNYSTEKEQKDYLDYMAKLQDLSENKKYMSEHEKKTLEQYQILKKLQERIKKND